MGLLSKLLYTTNAAMFAPLVITNNDLEHFIINKTNLPSNFTKLGKYIMISNGSWVFIKKEKASNNVYAGFRLNSQVPLEKFFKKVSFEFNRLGGKTLFKKQHQSLETEIPIMLLFVCNGTDQGSIKSDTKQMLETVLDNIKTNGMFPKEFKNKFIPHFTLKLNAPLVPS